MLLEDKKLIFLHIPKNAGTSIELMFGRVWNAQVPRPSPEWPEELPRHATYLDYSSRPDFDHYTTFAVVRNPWDRVVSAYFFDVQKAALGKHLDKHNRALAARGASFEEYVRGADYTKNLLRPQLRWLCDSEKRIAVAHILRMEQLASDFERMAAQLNIKAPEIPHANRTSHKPYSEYYTQETQDIVANAYKEEIAAFGFQFNRPTPPIRVSSQ